MQLIEALYPKNYQNLKGPILETYEALLGAQKGAAPSSLLAPKPTSGSRTNRPEIERLQGEAAAAMQLLMKAGNSKDEAARKVARRVSKFDLKSLGYTRKHRTGITATTIKGWRDKFRGIADDSLGSMRYTHVLDSLEGADPEAAAAVALKFVLGSMLPENREKPPS